MRCINLDWLEVFCKEPPTPRDAQYFASLGFPVNRREYGTPQYQEMFTISKDGEPFVEVRRNPYSKKSNGGIMDDNACHIRVVNKVLYRENPVGLLRDFLSRNGYTLGGLTRVDVCLDFTKLDAGDNPASFIKKYMSGKIAKVNQCNIAAHGKDSFSSREWNSLSWGAEKSMIRTKIYNKSLEMKEAKDKAYIRTAWYSAGLIQNIDDVDTQVWRVEFSIKSEAKKWVVVEDESSDERKLSTMYNTLSCYDTRDKCMIIFHSLASHYFHFKKVEIDDSGKKRRKDRCEDLETFKYKATDVIYKVMRDVDSKLPTRTDKLLIKRCLKIEADESRTLWLRDGARATRIALSNDVLECELMNRKEEELRRFDVK